MRRLRRAAVLAALCLVLPAAGAPARAGGPRAASATVCGDQYLLKLADADQIAALSPQAGDRWLSLLSDAAAPFARLRPSAEGYVAAGVEVVLANAWSDHKTMDLLERFGVRVVRIPLVDSFAEVEAVTRTVAEALGHPERGEALNAAIRGRLAGLRAEAAGAGRRALYLRPGGGSAAEGTFVDAVMAVTGLANRATAERRRGWVSYGLEQIVLDPPELLVTSFFDSPDRSLFRAFGSHPAFTRRAAAVPAVEVPGRTWVCSAWILDEAAAALAAGLRRLPPPP